MKFTLPATQKPKTNRMFRNFYKSGTLIPLSVFLLMFFSSLVARDFSLKAQIYEPEGINMPGFGGNWTNPPSNLAFASNTQVAGGRVTKISTGTPRWQTIFSVAASGGDVTGGTFGWLFTSGSTGNPWGNKWGGVTVSMNTLQNYYIGGADNSISVTNGKWYTMNWKDDGYTNTEAIYMETSAQPVLLSSLSVPSAVAANTSASITLTLSGSPAAEELFYLRYTSNNWASSSLTTFSLVAGNWTATIPAQSPGAEVKYYAFSSTVSNVANNFDLYSIHLSPSYSYTVNGLSTQAEILSFSFAEQTTAGVINPLAATVAIEVAYGTNLTSLTPTISVSAGATINPASGVSRDFSSTVSYTVTSEAATTKDWAVNVTVAPPPSFDWVNLQWPGNGAIQPGDEFFVYAQAYEGGITPGSGQGAGVQAWIGYSTENTNPNTWSNWILAPYFGESGNNDEFRLNLGAEISSPGTYYYASRFQLGSSPYQYGGFGDGFWNGSSSISGILTIFPTATTWTGALSNDWNVAGNWSNGLPGNATDVTIPVGLANYPTLTSGNPGSCHNLNILSDATGTGSILGNENLAIGGTVSVERYFGGWVDALHGWHLVSSPVSSQAIQPGFVSVPPTASEDFFSWDEAGNTWTNSKLISGEWNPSFDNYFATGKGYLAAYQNNSTKVFSGVLTSGDVNITNLSNNTSSTNHGWNLLGNPFASALVWNNGAAWSLNNVAATAKVWNEASASYFDITPNGIIPAMNGFMVQVTGSNSTGSITIPASSRVHSSQSWYKNSSNEIALIARDLHNQTAQKCLIKVNEAATEDFDNEFDAHFLAGFAPRFYSIQGNDFLSTNTLPDVSESRTIVLGFEKNEASEFSIELNQTQQQVVILTDRKTGIVTDLSNTAIYNFTSEDGDANDRFTLSFRNANALNELTTGSFSVYAGKGYLNILSEQPLSGKVTITDMTGRSIMSQSLTSATFTSIPVSQPGVYIVNIRSTHGTMNQKVVVQ